MHVVAIQNDMVWQDKPASQDAIRQLLAGVTVPGGSLIVLPEMYDTGFSMNLDATAQDPQQRESEAFLRQLAREYDSAVLGGVVSPIHAGMARNQAVAFAPDGTELVRYDKMQPFTLSGEDVKYQRGQQHRIFTWQGLQVAPFVCYDLRFPEIFRPAVADGAELIVVMACWPETRSEHWVRLLQARAIENLAYTVGVNRCGTDPKLTYDGRSCAFDHMGTPLFEADRAPQVLSTEVDVAALRRWRKKFPALRDMQVR